MPPGQRVDWSTVTDLGKVRDELIAIRLGVLEVTVARHRCRRGLRMIPRTGIDWSKVADLGKLPDAVIAHRLRCTRGAVATARHRRNIAGVVTRRTSIDLPLPLARAISRRFPGVPFHLAAVEALAELVAQAHNRPDYERAADTLAGARKRSTR